VDGEFAALAHRAFDGDAATVGLDDALDDGKAEAGAAELAAPGLVDAVEALEEAGKVLRVNATAVVADADDDLAPSSLAAPTQTVLPGPL